MKAASLNIRAVLERQLPRLLVVAAVVAAAAFSAAKTLPAAAQVHFSYLVSLSAREASPDFHFDGFYALQATELFAATLAEWARTPEVIVQAHTFAQLPVTSEDPRQLTRLVEAKKIAPQLVVITVKNRDAAVATALATGLRQAMAENLTLYHDKGIPALQFQAVATTPWVGRPRVAVGVITVATFFFTFFIGINAVLFLASLQPRKI